MNEKPIPLRVSINAALWEEKMNKMRKLIAESLNIGELRINSKPRTATEIQSGCTQRYSPHTATRAADIYAPRLITHLKILFGEKLLKHIKGKARRKIRRKLRKLRKQV